MQWRNSSCEIDHFSERSVDNRYIYMLEYCIIILIVNKEINIKKICTFTQIEVSKIPTLGLIDFSSFELVLR